MPRLKCLRIFYTTAILGALACLVLMPLALGVPLPSGFLVKVVYEGSWLVFFVSSVILSSIFLFPNHAERQDNGIQKIIIVGVLVAVGTKIYLDYIEPMVLPA
jgi:hypothetical protein